MRQRNTAALILPVLVLDDLFAGHRSHEEILVDVVGDRQISMANSRIKHVAIRTQQDEIFVSETLPARGCQKLVESCQI
jgi:hypothetical protein